MPGDAAPELLRREHALREQLVQLALAAQVFDGIQKGELDPNAVRVDPYGGRKKGDLEKMFGFMLGDAQLDKLDVGSGSGGDEGRP